MSIQGSSWKLDVSWIASSALVGFTEEDKRVSGLPYYAARDPFSPSSRLPPSPALAFDILFHCGIIS